MSYPKVNIASFWPSSEKEEPLKANGDYYEKQSDDLHKSVDLMSEDCSDESVPIHNRAQWGNRWQFVLSCLGYTVGLGNVVRFPYLAVQEGGGAFLIPYVIFLLLSGVPLMFVEFGIAQYSGLSCLKAFNIAPIFKGIGWCMVAVEIVLCTYYNALMAWVIYYIAMSFNWPVPWSTCGNWWNTPGCFVYSAINDTTGNATDMTKSLFQKRSAAEEFWFYNVLEISKGIDDLGGVNWKIALCVIASWVAIFLCLFKGVKSIGKVVYVTAVAPYILITVMLVRAVTLEGSIIGIRHYIIPKWEKLTNIRVSSPLKSFVVSYSCVTLIGNSFTIY